MKYSKNELVKMFEQMLTGRRYEEKVMELVNQGKIGSFYHLGIGQEAVGVGVMNALGSNDYFQPTHRSHPALLCRLDMKKMTAELLGRSTGYNGGKASTIHITSTEDKVLPSNGILGANIPLTTGFALGMKLDKKDGVVVCVIGDGAFSEGNVYEGLNIASLFKVPLVVVIENNNWAVSNPVSRHTSVQDLSSRASAYGLTGITVDGNDVIRVREAVENAIVKAKNGEPSLVEAKTYRWRGHFEGDPCAYRDPHEFEEAKKKDCLKSFEKYLLENGFITEALIKGIEQNIKQRIEEAFDYAFNSPIPTVEETLDLNMVYASVGGEL